VTPSAAVMRTVRRTAHRFVARWPGRVLLGTVAALVRIQVFDRAMTIAAQAFTSIFPVVILVGAVLGRGPSARMAELAQLPQATQQLLDDALRSGGIGAFGLAGSLVVLISATSLSRALARTYCSIWTLDRSPTGLRSYWRWLAAVFLLAGYLFVTRLLGSVAGQLPFARVPATITLVLADAALAVFIPWLLLSGAVPVRVLMPAGCVFGLAMLVVRPVGAVYLPRALAASGDRYGSIGLAFTYIGWLYLLSLCLLASAVLGQVLANDEGTVGRLIRGAR
jgi:membrane protein